MFIFYFLGVGPPCHSILCQFWLCEEAQCVYLRCHLGSPKHYFDTVEYYAAERKKELLPFMTAWMELESIMLSEISQVVKDKYHMISPIGGT